MRSTCSTPGRRSISASSGRTTTPSTCSTAPMRTNLYLLTSLGRHAADLSIGTFCHENGHLLCRFPDMYDYGERDGDSVRSAGIGSYCLMGSGNHLDSGRSPSPVCAYLRDLAGWCDNEVDLNVAGVRGEARRLQHRDEVPHSSKPNEYFLVENRAADGDGSGPAGQRPGRLPLRHLRLERAPAGDGGDALPVRAAPGRRAPRPRAERQHRRRQRPVRPDAGLVAVEPSSPHTREWDGRDSTLSVSNISVPAP